jgi:hypothetical protein
MMDKSKTPPHKLDSGTIPNGLEGFWICPSFKDPFLSRRANLSITIRNFLIAVRCRFCPTGDFGYRGIRGAEGGYRFTASSLFVNYKRLLKLKATVADWFYQVPNQVALELKPVAAESDMARLQV